MSPRALAVAALLSFGCAGAPPEPAKPLPPLPAPTPTPAPASVAAPDRARLPAPAATPAWALTKPEIFTLTNGMKVFFVEQGPTPLVSVLLVLPRGGATDPKGKAGLTALTADLLDEGAGGKDALELSEELQRIGTDYAASADVDNVMLAMNTIADSFEPSVKLLADIAIRPKLDAKEFARRKDQRIADALSAESEPASARAVVLRKALFASGYASELASGTRTTLGRISLGDVKAQYHAVFAAEGASLIVVGGIDRESVKRALEQSFGAWKGSAKAKDGAVSAHKPEKAIFFVDFPGATQTSMTIATRAQGEGASDYFQALVMSRVLGEAFTSRLNLNLREAKGYTYGAGSSFRRFKALGLFGLSANVKRETTLPSIEESFKELRDLCASRPISETERNEAVNGLLLGFPGRFEHGGDVAGQLANIPLYGRAEDWLETWSSKVKAISVGQANEAAKSYCNPDDYVVVLAGDRKAVAPTLTGLERKVLYFDAQGKAVK